MELSTNNSNKSFRELAEERGEHAIRSNDTKKETSLKSFGRCLSLMTGRAESLYIYGGSIISPSRRKQRAGAGHVLRQDLCADGQSNSEWYILPVEYDENSSKKGKRWWTEKGQRFVAPTNRNGTSIESEYLDSPMFIYAYEASGAAKMDFLMLTPKKINGRQVESFSIRHLDVIDVDNSLHRDKPKLYTESLYGDYQTMQILCANDELFYCIWNCYRPPNNFANEILDSSQRLPPSISNNGQYLLVYELRKCKNDADRWTWRCLTPLNSTVSVGSLMRQTIDVIAMNDGKAFYLPYVKLICFLPTAYYQHQHCTDGVGAGRRNRLSFLLTFCPIKLEYAEFCIDPDHDAGYPISLSRIWDTSIVLDNSLLFFVCDDSSEGGADFSYEPIIWQLQLSGQQYHWSQRKLAIFQRQSPPYESSIIFWNGRIYSYGGLKHSMVLDQLKAIRIRPSSLMNLTMLATKRKI